MATTKVKAGGLADNAVTVTKLPDSSITNVKLNNSSITINGSDVSLGGSVTVGETKPTVANVAQTIAPDTATTINITGTNFVSIPQVQFVKSDTGAIITANTVSFTNATTLSVNVTLALGNYFVRVENPDGNAGRSSNNILTASTAPTFSTNAGSLGTVAGDFSGTVTTVAASSDSAITFSETTNVLTNSSQANCSLNPSTGEITTTDFGGSSTSGTAYNFTLRATDQEAQTVDRAFSLTSSFNYSATYLIVAGGGRGGNVIGGGGGAGGLLTGTTTLTGGITFTVTVGDGETSAGSPRRGGNSSLAGSSITTLTAIGGGEGGEHGGSGNAYDGGSGGGAGGNGSDGTTKQGGSETAGQGFGGGDSSNDNYGAGGGGASAAGANGGPGNGGNGLANSITGSAVTYAGGGGGGHRSSSGSAGSGGSGGGGNGTAMGSVGQAGTANLGGGGGAPNGSGGSGVVILSVPSEKYSGNITGSPTISVSGSQRIIKFTQSGTYTA